MNIDIIPNKRLKELTEEEKECFMYIDEKYEVLNIFSRNREEWLAKYIYSLKDKIRYDDYIILSRKNLDDFYNFCDKIIKDDKYLLKNKDDFFEYNFMEDKSEESILKNLKIYIEKTKNTIIKYDKKYLDNCIFYYYTI